tara:strand:+ start:455 stop:2173 length:1719 start_codon:yes stop_codon:yes gene_type:complete
MSCRDRVLDVFVTNGDSDYRQGYDDTFVGPVWSIRFDKSLAEPQSAVVVNASTDWVTFCQTDANGDDVNVGDLVRFGNAPSDGHTDYVTVLERVKVNKLYNGVFHEASKDASVADRTLSMWTQAQLDSRTTDGAATFWANPGAFGELPGMGVIESVPATEWNANPDLISLGTAVPVAVQIDLTTVAQSAQVSATPQASGANNDWFTGSNLNSAANGLANDAKVLLTNPPSGLLAQQNANLGTRNPPYWYIKNLQADKFQLSWDNSQIWANTVGSFLTVYPNFSVRRLVDHFQANAHGYTDNDKVTITNAPSQLTNDFYYVVNKTANDFQVSATSSGTAIADLGAVSASCTVAPVGFGLLQDRLNAPEAVDLWAYRLNFAINLTDVSVPWFAQHLSSGDQKKHIVKYRHTILHSTSRVPTAQRVYYPMYKVNKWLTNNGDISVSLDHGVKSLHWIKLVAYSVFNKRQVGFQAAHEMEQDDWVAMHVNEVEGGVVSNNPSANGAFCVLHVGGAKDNETGAVEYHAHDPQGLYTHYFDNHNSTVRNLNLRFLDRKGNAAHFGRIHLWFKLCVQHG